ncbi:sensor histidine kinase [Ornithinimicrobium humiphilum]|uniref:sensor histidine kinase n=1 Tax=Ornithinimicrobium humiphilum TaxID=125288 RepID=UPI003B529D63
MDPLGPVPRRRLARSLPAAAARRRPAHRPEPGPPRGGQRAQRHHADALRRPRGAVVVRRDAALRRRVADPRGGRGAGQPPARHAVLRIVREAVTNAARHGRAGRVEVRMTREGGATVVSVTDDGCGFDPASVQRGVGYGIMSMAERARSLPGTLSIDSEPGRGSEIRVRW